MLTPQNGLPPADEAEDLSVLPKIVPPLPVKSPHARDLPASAAMGWLRAGWKDIWNNPLPSLLYGIGVFAGSALFIWLLYRFEMDYALLPALAGFMVVGPMIANGLYLKSRNLEEGRKTGFFQMVFVHPRSGASGYLMGVILLMLFMLWMRSAVILWALFFGIQPFPGMSEIIPTLLYTTTGWWLLLVGVSVGALFASFGFAISIFAFPMLLEEKTDALSAMGISMAMVWRNLPVMLTWGFIVMVLFILSLLTGLVGLILVFPLLGHGTWHAYRAIRPVERQKGEAERMFLQPV